MGKSKTDENNFPARLHYMLQELEKDGLEHIISWRPHGRAFIVSDQEAFAKEILPLWFRQSKYSSFQRQLNLYGFKRITSGTDKGSHYHEQFVRGMQALARQIVRTKVKGTGARKSRSQKSEPNFYSMSASPLPTPAPVCSHSSGVSRVVSDVSLHQEQATFRPCNASNKLLLLALAQQQVEQGFFDVEMRPSFPTTSSVMSNAALAGIATSPTLIPSQLSIERDLLMALLRTKSS